MPTQHTVTSYKFEELSDKAKEKARDWFRQAALGYEWWEHVYDDAETIGLKITGFDLGRSQDVDARFSKDSLDVARAILENHGEGCETFKLATEYIAQAKTSRTCDECGAPFHLDAAEVAYHGTPDDIDHDADEDHTAYGEAVGEEEYREFLRDLRSAYWDILNKEAEFLTSDECVDEGIAANDYDFDINGNRFRY